ncbi:MAG: hypothetical protein M3Z04_08915 [Chloroflexota bacterium]|nr:hypothetical protein [Chloroflexota bacterium]
MDKPTTAYGPGVAAYIRADDVRLSNGAAGIVTARDAATLRNGGGVAFVAGGDLALTNGGGAAFVAGHDLSIQNGGGALLVAGGNLSIQNGGGALFVSRTAQVRRGIVICLLAPRVSLHEGSRVLITPAVAAIFGVGVGLGLGLLRWGLRRGR